MRHCYVCDMQIPRSARLCPYCRKDPHVSLSTQEGRERRAQEKVLRNHEERMAYAVRGETVPSGGATADQAAGWFGLIVILLIIGAVISFFQWMGSRISLRFGADYMPLAAAVLALWFLAAGALLWRGIDRDEAGEAKAWSPFAAWLAAMLLILFLPDSLGRQAIQAPSEPEAAASEAADADEPPQPTAPAEGQQVPAAALDQAAVLATQAADEAAPNLPAPEAVSAPVNSAPAGAPPGPAVVSLGVQDMPVSSEGETVRRTAFHCRNRNQIRYVYEVSGNGNTFAATSRSGDYESGSKQVFGAYAEAVASVCEGF